MADALQLPKTLVRSVARAFYDPRDFDTRHILIVEALIYHSALRDDDLSHLMNMNLKDLHRLCAKLRDDRLLQIHVRPELREGHNRPTNRTYYFIDYRQAIDAIKWRVFTIDKAVQGDAKPSNEKKEYFCARCKAEWTQMEVLDKMDPAAGFRCHRCDHVLTFDPDREAGGHEHSTKLNNQLRFVTDLLPKIDSAIIPECTFDDAHRNSRPVFRDATNQVAASVAVESMSKPTAVKGMANTGPQTIAISITDSEAPTEAEKEAERIHREKIAASNALPVWHTNSTVTNASYVSGADQTTAIKGGGDDDDVKIAVDQGNSEMDYQEDIDKILNNIAMEQQREAEEDSDEEDEDEREEEEEFEDITNSAVAASPAAVDDLKRSASSGPTSTADTPTSDEKPAKRVKVEEPPDDAESEDEDLAFEDV